jgi:hypothetical protein
LILRLLPVWLALPRQLTWLLASLALLPLLTAWALLLV